MAKKPKIDWRAFGRETKVLIDDFDGSLREFGRTTGIDKATLSRMQNGKPLDPVNFLWICQECHLDPWSFFKR
jgi:hypothetical protein